MSTYFFGTFDGQLEFDPVPEYTSLVLKRPDGTELTVAWGVRREHAQAIAAVINSLPQLVTTESELNDAQQQLRMLENQVAGLQATIDDLRKDFDVAHQKRADAELQVVELQKVK